MDLSTLTASVDAEAAQAIPVAGAALFANVAPGDRMITLGGVPANCAVEAPNPRPVRVESAAEASVLFAVTCRTRVARVIIVPAAAFFLPGDTTTFTATAYAADGSVLPERVVRWEAPDGVAAVTGGGLVTGLASGTGRLRAIVDGVEGSGELVVGASGRPARGISFLQYAFGPNGFSVQQLWRTASDGAAPQPVTPSAENAREAVWSPNGSRAAVRYEGACTSAGCFGRSVIVTLTADGTGEATAGASYLTGLDWSPDGTRLAGSVSSRTRGESSLRVVDVRTGVAADLLDVPGDEITPQWSPDGTRIAFLHHGSGVAADQPWELWVANADGSAPRRLAAVSAAYRPRWSPDGRRLAFDDGTPFSPYATGVWIVDVDGTGLERLAVPVAVCPATGILGAFCTVGMPAWSPDGRRIAFGAGAAALGAPASLIVRVLASAVPDVVIAVGPCCGGGEGIPAVTWSPDARWLLFGGRRAGAPPWPSAVRVSSRGGTPQYLTNGANAFDPRWMP